MKKYAKKYIAIPQDHGSWVFLFSPLIIGFFVGGSFTTPGIYLLIAAIAVFLVRQPVIIAVKAYSGRRPRSDLPAARFWMLVYGFIALLMVVGLVWRGFISILYLAVPGIATFIWHLSLVGKRAERKQAGLEIVASGTLALAAPAALWVSRGGYSAEGWLLWVLVWFQSAASIVHAYMRLAHRAESKLPSRAEQVKIGERALLYTSFNLLVTLIFGILGWLPRLIFLPYLLQWAETLWWTFHPAINAKPTQLGIRQLAVSSLFTLLFIVFWSF